MNPRILNRDGKLPTDGFYQIEVAGEYINHQARVVQVIDEKAVDAIVNRFASEAKAGGTEFAGMRIDKDHLGKSMENPTESLGWSMQVRNRGGLEAKIDWTALGLPLIDSKPGQPPVYKFFSTEYDRAECEKIGTRIINRKSYDVVRPLRLDGLSLTNDPNNKGQRPISNRNPAATAEPAETKTMKALLKQLGLAEDASEESAVAAVQSITNRATRAESQVTALTTERDGLLTAQVETDLEKYKNRFKPENRDRIKASLIANRKGTIDLLEATEPAVVEQRTRIVNRAAAQTPGERDTTATDADEGARAQKITNRALEIQKLKSEHGRVYPFASAFREAETENPATAAKK